MPIDAKNKRYEAYENQWFKCRMTIEGEDAIKAADSINDTNRLDDRRFLPMLEGQTSKQYEKYKARALFYNATGRTHQVLLGLVFRKDMVVDMPAGMDSFKNSVTASGENLDSFTRKCMDEMLAVSRGGVLVDFPQTDIIDAEGRLITRTVDQVESMKIQPYFSFYNTESIINWKTTIINTEEVIEWIILKEVREEPQEDDPYVMEEIEVYRKLYINDSGWYTQEVHAKDENNKYVVIEGPTTPLMNGKPLDYIPFFYFNGNNMSISEVKKPMLIDLVNINISHYHTSADNEHALHYTALPTAVITGIRESQRPDNEVFAIGSAAAWKLPEGATAFYLEFQGHGLEPMANAMKDKEQMMAKVGARLLAGEKKAAEAAQTAQINRSGESATLADRANLVGMVITKCLETARDWMGLEGEITVTMNTDYMPLMADFQMVTALLNAWQMGGISYETFYHNLQKGEYTIPNRTVEDEQGAIDREEPSITPVIEK